VPSVPTFHQPTTTPARSTGFEVLLESLAAASPEQGGRSRTESRRKRHEALEQNSDRHDDMMAAMAAPTQSSTLRDLQRAEPAQATDVRKTATHNAAGAHGAKSSAFAGELTAARRPVESPAMSAAGSAMSNATAIGPSPDRAQTPTLMAGPEVESRNGPPGGSGDAGWPVRQPSPVLPAGDSSIRSDRPRDNPPPGAFELNARLTQNRPSAAPLNSSLLPSSSGTTVASSAPASIVGGESASGPTDAPNRRSPGKAAPQAATRDSAESAEEGTAAERVVRVLKAQFGRDSGTSVIRLDPPELGYLRVELNLRRDGVTLLVDTQTAAAHELLSQDVDGLRSQLEAAGLRADRIEVRPPPAGTSPEFASDSSHLKQRGDESADGRRRAARADRNAPVGAVAHAAAETASVLEAAAGKIVNRIAAEPRLNVWA